MFIINIDTLKIGYLDVLGNEVSYDKNDPEYIYDSVKISDKILKKLIVNDISRIGLSCDSSRLYIFGRPVIVREGDWVVTLHFDEYRILKPHGAYEGYMTTKCDGIYHAMNVAYFKIIFGSNPKVKFLKWKIE